MSITVKEVLNKKDLKAFVKLPFAMYKDDPMWVPQLIRDDMEVFNRAKNPAFDNADARQFLAYKDGKAVGRIAAILSSVANQKYNTRNLRFGWFDAPNDPAVAAALFRTVEAWAKELGMETLTGPHGFCDLDPQGMLVEGFDQLPTIAGYYNFPYYQKLVEDLGFQKEVDYVEFRTHVPEMSAFPEKLLRLAERIKERGGLRVLKFAAKKELLGRAEELFHLLDETFEEIYGAVPLTERQIHYFIKKYFSFVDKDLIQAVVNEKDEMVGFMIAMPNFSRAFQKARGRLLPLGWWHLLRAIKKNDVLDFYLAGIKKNYRGQGVDLLMVVEMAHKAIAKGFRYTESNQELETNTKIQAQWKYFNPVQHKRKRIFKKVLK
ncbi:MAG: hypothetical protein KJ808_05040 [Acidobacteria bacterium]|nr:hypothetical protein [Acidobacteriota bacterium]MBU4307903.1 hypothetical protein [Acidobacteriota bacterium]MBU4405916.1 hypothetical protein [Acidobacteriota bacterium]MCG2811041.1 hypothetical protein [Candidatus Aminicenantes bacterium]